jgi:hypothetical protein
MMLSTLRDAYKIRMLYFTFWGRDDDDDDDDDGSEKDVIIGFAVRKIVTGCGALLCIVIKQVFTPAVCRYIMISRKDWRLSTYKCIHIHTHILYIYYRYIYGL